MGEINDGRDSSSSSRPLVNLKNWNFLGLYHLSADLLEFWWFYCLHWLSQCRSMAQKLGESGEWEANLGCLYAIRSLNQQGYLAF